jgi:pimeloyl-ACP methyl ester carboxylesterase
MTPPTPRPRWPVRARCARALRTVIVAYAAVLLLLWSFQSQLLYPGAGRAAAPPPADAQLLTFMARDGAPVHALEVDPPQTPPLTVVYFHGNGELVGDDVWIARALAQRGFRVVLVEYRGYGVSQPGEPNEAGLYADAEAVLNGLAARGVHREQVVLWGISLGTGVATEMAARGLGGALVLVAPYTSMVDAAWSHYPFVPVSLLLKDRYDSLRKAANVRMPTVVLHGTDDYVVPFAMGKQMAAAISGARFIGVTGGHHMDLFSGRGGRYFDEVAAVVNGGMGR